MTYEGSEIALHLASGVGSRPLGDTEGETLVDVLLTHSYHLPYDAKQLRKMQPYTPIGTLYAAAALRDQGVSVAVFDTMLRPLANGFTAMLERLRPRIVAVYEDDFNFLTKMCLTRMRDVAWEIARASKAIGATVIVHGSDSTDNPSLFLTHGFDYVLCGEAETTLASLCAALLEGAEPQQLDGLVRLDSSGQLVYSPQRLAKNPSWADLSPPARDLIDLEPYRASWLRAHGYFSTNMVASRGCPFRCNWCAKPISGNQFHLRPASAVAEEMEYLKHAGVDHIWFGDDVFALNHHWVREFAEEVGRRDASLPFKIQSRADLLREDTVLHLKAAGCSEVWMGVESGAQEILDAMDKGITLASVSTACERLRKAGIRACFFLQFGYPGEDWDKLRQTIALVRRLRPEDIGVSFSYPLPGTVFYDRVKSQLGAKRNWADSDDLSIMFQAAYSTDFYLAVREALHAEVDSWHHPADDEVNNRVAMLWDAVEEMEPLSRASDTAGFPRSISLVASSSIVPVEQLTSHRKA
jgi:anaerobic magnesium-protoporphyrin IX monomethyl ester cyclase